MGTGAVILKTENPRGRRKLLMAAGSFRRFSASSTAGGREARDDRELKATA
jgi:hypothetical protein